MSASVSSGFHCAAPVETVAELLSSPRWAAVRDEHLQDGSRVEEHLERPDGSSRLVVSRELPEGTPAPFQRFLPADGRVIQTDEWQPASNGSRAADWSVQLPGAPAGLAGRLSVSPTADGCWYDLSGDVTVKVPLVGGRAESFIAGLVRQLADKEAELVGLELGVAVRLDPR